MSLCLTIFFSIIIRYSPPSQKDCVNFLDRALQIYPERRLTAEDGLSHIWVKGQGHVDHKALSLDLGPRRKTSLKKLRLEKTTLS